jgi:trimeric autotransporter adhesin
MCYEEGRLVKREERGGRVKIWNVIRAVAAFFLVVAVAIVSAQSAYAATRPAPTGVRGAAVAACAPALSSVSLSPASVPGGAPSTVKAALTCAPTTTQTITLTGFSGARVPAALHVPAGKTSASGTVTTATRVKAVSGWITGTLGQTSHRARLTITVTPATCTSPALSAVSLRSLAYVGDHPVLTVKLSCATASPVQISLASTAAPSSAPAVPVPATVTVGTYYSSATIVLAPKAYEPGQYASTISASYGGATLSRTITVDPGLSVFANSPDSCSPNDVNLNILFTGGVPSSGLTVNLKSDNPAITVPPTVAFTQPGSLGGGVSGVTVNPVSTTTKVTLSATLGSRTLTVSVVLIRPWQSGDKITLTPSPGPGPFYGPSLGYEYLVYLNHPAPTGGSGLNGTVTTNHPKAVQFDGNQVNVTAGCNNTAVSFSVPYESHPVHATVTVSLGGSTATASLTIEPSLASVTLPATIVGGQSATGTVTLAGAPDRQETVFLQSTWGILTVPDSVTVPAGQVSATFPITTVPVTSDSQVNVNAWHSVSDQTADSVESNTTDVIP